MDDLGRYPKGKTGRDPLALEFTEPSTGLRFVELNHVWGHGSPVIPGDPDLRIERPATHARDGVTAQKFTGNMHISTHLNAPIHLVQGGADVASLEINRFFGSGVVLDLPRGRWEMVTAADLEAATPAVREGDIVVIHTGWHRKYSDSMEYFGLAPGLSEDAAAWLVKKKVALVGVDTPFVDNPMATSMAAHRNGPLMKRLPAFYKSQTGREAKTDFPKWNPAHKALLAAGIPTIENIGGGVDLVKGKRVTIQALPWRFQHGDACVVRVMAILDPTGAYRVASGK
jgi:kynurenine formamidase